jgi:Ca2+-binding RTX toxin-like protein
MEGGRGSDRLFGGAGDNRMSGGAGSDRLIGGEGGDTMTGGAGADRLSGGAGNDDLRGGGGRDALNGGSGRDSLDGGGGSDVLVGGANADTFSFSSALGAGNVDTIRGYSRVSDTIELDSGVFTGLAAGVLPASAFRIGATAADASDRVIYDDGTGALFFDPDGSGTGAAQVQFATLVGAPDLTRFDFVVI